jgi:phage shock protein E
VRHPSARRTGLGALAVGAVLLAGCGVGEGATVATTDGTTASAETNDVAALAEGRTLIDVRTSEEVAEGMLEGALHLDVQDPAFEQLVGELPRDEAYLVYCRSGNRSGQAIDRMRALGFEDLVNGGAYDDLVEAGLPTS